MMSTKANRKRLNEAQHCEIITKLRKSNPPSKRAISREYNVSKRTIRKVRNNREAILQISALLSEDGKKNTFRASVGRFTQIENMMYIWTDNMLHTKLPLPPSLAIAKAKTCF